MLLLMLRLLLSGLAFWGLGAAFASLVDRPSSGIAVRISMSLACASVFWSMMGVLLWNHLVWPGLALLLAILATAAALALSSRRAGLRCTLRQWAIASALPLLGGGVLISLIAVQYSSAELLDLNTHIGGIGQRTHTFATSDAVLQYHISNNFQAGVDIETHFRPRGQGLWSAGDRPLWMGFIDATLASSTGTSGAAAYLFRFYCIHSLLLLLSSFIVGRCLNVTKRLHQVVLLGATFSTTFWWANALYTWPKLTGLVFSVAGAILMYEGYRSEDRIAGLLGKMMAGSLFAFSVLCHGGSIFGVFMAVAVLVALNWKANKWNNARNLVVVGLPLVTILSVHARYINTHTFPTNLLSRVMLCKNGSYEHPTPVVSLAEACTDYVKHYGLRTVLQHRIESLHRNFLNGYSAVLAVVRTTPIIQIPRALRGFYLNTVPVSYGLLALPLAACLAIANAFRRNDKWTVALLFLWGGLLLTGGYSLLIGFASELAPHTLPYAAQWLLAIGATAACIALPRMIGIPLLGLSFLWGAVPICTYYLDHGQTPAAFVATATFLALTGLLVYLWPRSERPDAKASASGTTNV